jgi:hypothetical protein
METMSWVPVSLRLAEYIFVVQMVTPIVVFAHFFADSVTCPE